MASRGRNAADERLIAELASGKSVVESAAAASISERTAHRRLTDPEFSERVKRARSQYLDDALGVLSATTTAAATTLKELLTHADANMRFRAAVEVLKAAVRIREHAEFDERLKAIEERLANAQPEETAT